MPRKSPQGEIAAILNTKHHRIGPRPDCPPEVAEIFRELTSAVAPDHFRESDSPLLECYAEAIALSRRAYAEMSEHGPIREDGKASPWLLLSEKAHRSVVALSARLRLAPQQRFDRKVAGTSTRSNRPHIDWSE